MKVHITKVSSTNKKKDGTDMINKNGKPFFRVGIQTSEHGEEWINGFMPSHPGDWEGSEQELTITEEEFNGKVSKKFAVPRASDKADELMGRIIFNLANIDRKLDVLLSRGVTPATMEEIMPSFDILEEDEKPQTTKAKKVEDDVPEEALDDPSLM